MAAAADFCLVSSDDDHLARLARAARFAELAAAMMLSQRRASMASSASASASVDGLLLHAAPSPSTDHNRATTTIENDLLDPARPIWRRSPNSSSVGRRASRSITTTPNRRPSAIVAVLNTSAFASRPTKRIITASTLSSYRAARAGPSVSLPPKPAPTPSNRRRRPRQATTTMAPPTAAAASTGGGSPPPPPPRRDPGGGGGGGGGNNNNNQSGRSVSPAAANAAPNPPKNSTKTSSATLSIATLNLRGVMDRWRERRPVLAQAFKDLDADVLCMQEVLTGEAGQDDALLRPLGYGQPLACRAALANLAAGGGAGGSGHDSTTTVGFGWPGVAFAAAVRAALAVPPLAKAMAALPAGIEAWRERRGQDAPTWVRAARDAAMAPFFGNSIAVRSGGSSSSSPSSSSSSSWPPLLVASPLTAETTTATTTTPATWPRTPGEFLAAAFGRCCGGAKAASSSPSPSSDRGRVWVAGGHEVLVLGGFRAAHRVMVGVRLDGDDKKHQEDDQADQAAYLWVVNAHLDHAAAATRAEQAAAIIRWMGGGGATPSDASIASAVVLAGDFNAPASEQGVHGALKQAGFVSAYASAHGGKEPARTWPTGLQAPLADDEGEPHCADYVYVRELKEKKVKRRGGGGVAGGDNDNAANADEEQQQDQIEDEFRVRVLGARVAANEPWPQDPTLYPSDHAAVRAVLKVERTRRMRRVAVVGRRRMGQRALSSSSRDAAAEEGF
jgi:endonuclease/exonuclease/phosphatase family metal-dependent hydrolase